MLSTIGKEYRERNVLLKMQEMFSKMKKMYFVTRRMSAAHPLNFGQRIPCIWNYDS